MNVQFAWWYTHETPTTGDRTRPRAKDPPVANAKTTIMYLFGSARRCELVRSARCPFCPADCADARQLLVHLCCMHGHLYYARRGTTLVVSRTPLSDDWPPGIPSSLSPILRDDTPAFSFRNGREIADRLSSYLCKTHTLSSGSRLAELLGIGAPTMKPSRPRDDSRPTYRKWPKRKAPVSWTAPPPLPAIVRLTGRQVPLSVPLGKRVFYHGTTFTPCRLPDASVPDDSDLDVDDAWVRSQSDQVGAPLPLLVVPGRAPLTSAPCIRHWRFSRTSLTTRSVSCRFGICSYGAIPRGRIATSTTPACVSFANVAPNSSRGTFGR